MKFIEGQRQVEEHFGYWPKFCDAKIERFTLDLVLKKIELTLYYIDSDKAKEGRVLLVFNNVLDVKILDCLDDNIVDEILIAKMKTIYKICIVSCYGLNGGFVCDSIEAGLISS